MKKIKYSEAIKEGFYELLQEDPNVFIIGQGLWSPWYVGSTMTDLEKKFGKERILDSPVSENATTGIAIGAAMTGKKAIVVHPRMDFMLLAMDPIINQASNWSYLFNAKVPVPVVIRSIINRGGEQGAQHSQALQSFFMHIPGIKVVMPATPEDAKGLLFASVRDPNPVIFIDDRWCYEEEGTVPKSLDSVELGKANILKTGKDITIISASYMVLEAIKASKELKKQGVEAEVINLRTIKPWDFDTLCKSVKKTGKAIIADSGWVEGGIGAEISSRLTGELFQYLKHPILRVGLPNSPAPCARTLEEAYYPNKKTIIEAVEIILEGKSIPKNEYQSKSLPGLISF